MNNPITIAVEQRQGLARAGLYLRTSLTVLNAVIAVVAGISTLNMVSANYGMATLNEIASPMMQQLTRLGRQA